MTDHQNQPGLEPGSNPPAESGCTPAGIILLVLIIAAFILIFSIIIDGLR